jgi:hypothetical protein
MRTLFIEDRNEINEVIKACKTCYVAMADGDTPYVLPMNFALEGDVVILHSAQSGRMWETLKKNPKVCINWTLGEEIAWQNEKVGCSYRVKSKSVIVEGEAEILDDYDEKHRLLHAVMAQYSALEFKFNKPAIVNVGIVKVHIKNISGKVFGEKPAISGKQ